MRWGKGQAKTAAAVTPAPLPAAPVPAAGGVAVCQDCGAPISGKYCSNCGQETEIRTPTVRQFTHEMMDQYVAVEGKLGRTLRVLIARPGQLTLDYIEGRRQRYVRPLKLYVSISVVFFGVLGLLPDSFSGPFLQADKDAAQPAAKPEQSVTRPAAAPPDAAPAPAAPPPAAPPIPTPTAPSAEPDEHDLKAEIERDVAEGVKNGKEDELGDTIKGAIDKNLQLSVATRAKAKAVKSAGAFEKLTSAEQREKVRNKLLDDAPYAMFFLLPYFALLLRLLYRKNKQLYGVHLLCSVHLHCFAFLLLLLMLVPWEPWRQAMQWAGAAYAFFALRRVYGGTWWGTLWRMGVLYLLYVVAIGITALSGVLGLVFGGNAA
ncbi:MAG: DUF3667 domain-containing protein [Nevskia sp.]|nr:DUF3667 domain-containing protein [Nevskia sp.]